MEYKTELIHQNCIILGNVRLSNGERLSGMEYVLD